MSNKPRVRGEIGHAGMISGEKWSIVPDAEIMLTDPIRMESRFPGVD